MAIDFFVHHLRKNREKTLQRNSIRESSLLATIKKRDEESENEREHEHARKRRENKSTTECNRNTNRE